MLAVAVDGLDSRVSAAVLYRVSGDRCWPGGQRLGASLVHGAPGRGARERPAPRPSNDGTALCAFFLVSCPTRIGHGSPFLPSFVLTVILVQYRLAVWAKDGRRVFFPRPQKEKGTRHMVKSVDELVLLAAVEVLVQLDFRGR
jgi:hypothetical protein